MPVHSLERAEPGPEAPNRPSLCGPGVGGGGPGRGDPRPAPRPSPHTPSVRAPAAPQVLTQATVTGSRLTHTGSRRGTLVKAALGLCSKQLHVGHVWQRLCRGAAAIRTAPSTWRSGSSGGGPGAAAAGAAAVVRHQPPARPPPLSHGPAPPTPAARTLLARDSSPPCRRIPHARRFPGNLSIRCWAT